MSKLFASFFRGFIIGISISKLKTEKSVAYSEYKEAKKDMQEIVTVKANIGHLLSVTDNGKNKEIKRWRHDATINFGLTWTGERQAWEDFSTRDFVK